jgi:hypothetical protein
MITIISLRRLKKRELIEAKVKKDEDKKHNENKKNL